LLVLLYVLAIIQTHAHEICQNVVEADGFWVASHSIYFRKKKDILLEFLYFEHLKFNIF